MIIRRQRPRRPRDDGRRCGHGASGAERVGPVANERRRRPRCPARPQPVRRRRLRTARVPSGSAPPARRERGARGGRAARTPSRTSGTRTTRPTTSSTVVEHPVAAPGTRGPGGCVTSAGVTVAPSGRLARATTTGSSAPSGARPPVQRGEVAGDDRAGHEREGGRAGPEAEGARGTSEHGPAFRMPRRVTPRGSGKCGGSGDRWARAAVGAAVGGAGRARADGVDEEPDGRRGAGLRGGRELDESDLARRTWTSDCELDESDDDPMTSRRRALGARLRRRPVVGLVEARALEHDPGRAQHLGELATAPAGVAALRLLVERLPDLDLVTALGAAVSVGRHRSSVGPA